MIDCSFPIIEYKKGLSHFEWGLEHGSTFKDAIGELSSIRRKLMLEKNPSLKDKVNEMAMEQFEATKAYSQELAEELKGIAQGSQVSLEDIIILNNYTDFRDINLNDEGCSTVHIRYKEQDFAGQTWDMHSSAKNYLCLIKVPAHEDSPEKLIFSLVGCLGMMGINTYSNLVGVNNINTDNAKTSIVWPALVRGLLDSKKLKDMKKHLEESPVTSGHNYLLSTDEGGVHIEKTPTSFEVATQTQDSNHSYAFHTNHCLNEKIKTEETKISVNSTTFNRYELLDRKIENITSLESLEALLTDHEEFPKSICSHFESSAQDPSTTCGGSCGHIQGGLFHFWRGCQTHDQNFVRHTFKLTKQGFTHHE